LPTPLLIDLDGVLRISGQLAHGGKEFIEFIQKSQISACILSNTTKLPTSVILDFFQENEIDLGEIQIQTALTTTHDYVKKNYATATVYCEKSAISVFDDIEKSEQPEAVVLGDLGAGWTYDVMNKIFNQVMNGADIIAMQVNRFGKNDNGQLYMDAGAFIASIEYATGKKAKLMGKPSPIFFHSALKKIGINPTKPFYMLGDDLNADIKAGQDAGGKSILIMTGKTNRQMLENSNVEPDFVVDNLKEVIKIISDH